MQFVTFVFIIAIFLESVSGGSYFCKIRYLLCIFLRVKLDISTIHVFRKVEYLKQTILNQKITYNQNPIFRTPDIRIINIQKYKNHIFFRK